MPEPRHAKSLHKRFLDKLNESEDGFERLCEIYFKEFKFDRAMRVPGDNPFYVIPVVSNDAVDQHNRDRTSWTINLDVVDMVYDVYPRRKVLWELYTLYTFSGERVYYPRFAVVHGPDAMCGSVYNSYGERLLNLRIAGKLKARGDWCETGIAPWLMPDNQELERMYNAYP